MDRKIKVYSSYENQLVTSLNNAFDTPLWNAPIFDIASKSIAYATSSETNEEVLPVDDENEKPDPIKVAKKFVGNIKKIAADSYYFNRKGKQDGVVALRILGTDKCTVWKPHTNPIKYLAFNPSQTKLYTVSTGKTILAWDITPCLIRKAPKCLFKFERGISKAIINHIGFSRDEVFKKIYLSL